MIKARPCAGDIAAGETFPRGDRAIRLAQISRLCRGRRRAGDEAADPCLPRPWRDRGRGSQHQARPRRHSRGRVFRADPAIDRRRAQPGAARPAKRCRRSTSWWTMAGSMLRRRDDMREAYLFLRKVEHRLQMVNDDQTQTLPDDPAAMERLRAFPRLRRPRRIRRRARCPPEEGSAALCARLFEATVARGQSASSRFRRMPTTSARSIG